MNEFRTQTQALETQVQTNPYAPSPSAYSIDPEYEAQRLARNAQVKEISVILGAAYIPVVLLGLGVAQPENLNQLKEGICAFSTVYAAFAGITIGIAARYKNPIKKE